MQHYELTNARAALSEELSMKTKRLYILRHKIYYEQGNKSGKMLAKAVQNKKVASTIHQIRDNQGTLHSSNEEIAKVLTLLPDPLQYSIQP